MKIKEGLMLRKVKDQNIILSYDQSLVKLNGMISVNDTGAFIFGELQNEISFDDLLNKMIEKYNEKKEIIEKDLNDFLNALRSNNLLDE